MAAEKDIIVALELATTNIRAIAGQRMIDGSMQVIAYAEVNASNCIRKGIIDNIDKTTQAISHVLGQINLQLGLTISRVYVGLGGQSLHSIMNRIQRSFNEKTQISNNLVVNIMDTNRGIVYTDSDILDVVPQEYKVGNRTVPDIVGMQIDQLEANFLNIVARKSLAENIEKCVKGAGFEIAELLINPLSLGDTILSASEKRSGCALADIGADTTSVSIYTNNILRKLIVIPLGANNITMDIQNRLNIEPEEAEGLKNKYGRAWLEDYETASNNVIQLSHGREITESELCEITVARSEEILRNIWAQVEEEIDKLTSGIVLTGGGAQIRFITEAFNQICKGNKQIRIIKGLPTDIKLSTGVYIPDNGRTNSILSLLLHGDQNCVVYKIVQDIQEATTTEATNPIIEEKPVPSPKQEQDFEIEGQTEGDSQNDESGQEEVKRNKWGFFRKIVEALTDDENT